jgi:hypothetical protein
LSTGTPDIYGTSDVSRPVTNATANGVQAGQGIQAKPSWFEQVGKYTGKIFGNGESLPNPASTLIPAAIGALSNFELMNRTNYPTVQAQTADARLLDPTRAFQNIQTAYSGSRANIGAIQGGTGISNMLGLAASEATQRANAAADFEARNTGVLNQTGQYNAAQRAQADAINLQQKQKMI